MHYISYGFNALLAGFIFTHLTFQPLHRDGDQLGRNCSQMKVEVTVELSNVEIEVSNASEPLKYYVIDENNKLVSENISKWTSMPEGKYEFMVIDANGCWKKGDFHVTRAKK